MTAFREEPSSSNLLGLSLSPRRAGPVAYAAVSNDRQDTYDRVVEFVNDSEEEVSVKDIAQALDISRSYARELACEAVEQGDIQGKKSKPVIGYIFDEEGRARADGGEPQGDLHVLTTREGLLWAVREYAPERQGEAAGKGLRELRRFVRNEVADGTVPVAHAWRFSSS